MSIWRRHVTRLKVAPNMADLTGIKHLVSSLKVKIDDNQVVIFKSNTRKERNFQIAECTFTKKGNEMGYSRKILSSP